MANLNKVFLMGNLTRDPELRYVPSGAPVATFGLAVNRRYVTQQGEKKDEVCFVRVVVFGKQAESCSQHLSKGRLVFVEGRLQYRSWEQEGQKRTSLDVVADRVQFLGAPKPSGGVEAHSEAPKEELVKGANETDLKSDEDSPF
ncbi:MAG: single-stranded DNA-binding protein [Candidatus Omnitrophica bacterium]|nr:single-stranded DNA-binding protein [Candidatus Omnitrophota bacterium]